MVRFVPVDHDPFGGGGGMPPSSPPRFGANTRYLQVDHDPFAEQQDPLATLPADAQPMDYFGQTAQVAERYPTRKPQGGVLDTLDLGPDAPVQQEGPRFDNSSVGGWIGNRAMDAGAAAAPAFGGHNTIAETFDRVIAPFIPGAEPPAQTPEGQQKQAWMAGRGLGERAKDFGAFAASMPVRIATQGQYGAGDVATGLGFPNAGQSLSQGEQDFATANQPQLEAIQLAGEASLGTIGVPPLVHMPPKPRVEGAPRPYSPGPTPQMASQPSASAWGAREHVRDAKLLDLPVFGPAVAQAARSDMPMVAKVVEGVPVVNRPVRMGSKNFQEAAAAKANRLVGQYSEAGANPERAGRVVGDYFDRFRNERTIDRDDIQAMPDEQVQTLARTPPRDIGSFKTAADARYEAAWRNIPQRFRRGGSEEENPRLMGQMAETRTVLREITNDNVRMINAQAEADRAAGVRRRQDAPGGVHATRQGGLVDRAIPFKEGLLGESMRAVLDGNWSGSLQTLRNIKSALRRRESGIPDNEMRALDKGQLKRLKKAVDKDIDHLMTRVINTFATGDPAKGIAPDVQMANAFRKAQRDMRQADRFYRHYSEAMEKVKGLIGATRDMQVIDAIRNAAQAGGKADTELLAKIRGMAPPEVMDEIAAGLLRHIGQPTGQAAAATQDLGWSIPKAVAHWRSWSPQAQRIIFGHRPELYRSLQKFFNVAGDFADYEKLANTSRSGTHGIIAAAITAGPMFVLSNWAGLLMSGAGFAGLGYWLTSPAYVSWLTSSMKTQQAIQRGALSARAANGAIVRHGRVLRKLLAKDPNIDPNVANHVLRAMSEIEQNGNATPQNGNQAQQ